jgi:acetoin utilization deacetylase AcuC-like enzyme
VIAARAAQQGGAAKVLIVDWDVHHGNGTQALVETDETIRFVSLHQWPAYPGTGRASERGVGNVFNVPMPPGLEPALYVEALWDAVGQGNRRVEGPTRCSSRQASMRWPAIPLAGFTLEPEHYADLTRRLRERWPGAPFAAMLEGGYAPSRLADGVIAHLAAI